MWHNILTPSSHTDNLTVLLTVLGLFFAYSLLWALVRGLLSRRTLVTCWAIALQVLVWILVVWLAVARLKTIDGLLVAVSSYAVLTLVIAGLLYVIGRDRIGRRVTYYSVLTLVAVIGSSMLYRVLLDVGGTLAFTLLWALIVVGATYIYDIQPGKRAYEGKKSKKGRK